MRTLFIEYTYLNGNGGGIYAARSHINLFSSLSSSMTLLYPLNKNSEIEGIDINKIDDLRPIPDNRNLIKKIFDWLRGYPTRFFSMGDEIFDKAKYDVVVFDNSLVSANLIKKAKRKGIKVITIHHNYQVEYVKADGNPLTRWRDVFWNKKHEGEAVRLSDLNIVLTPQDAKLLAEHYKLDALFGCLGVCEYERQLEKDIPSYPRMHRYLITGGLSSRQNEVSIIRWLRRFYPLLLQSDPEAILTIAGRNPSKKLASFIKSKNVNLIESPRDMWPILQNSDYYICPVDCGGGLKLKIMDGLKAGMPIITHSVSARGYEPMKNAGVLFDYSDEKTFMEAVSKAIKCQKKQSDIYEDYCSVFSFRQGEKRLKSILSTYGFIRETKI